MTLLEIKDLHVTYRTASGPLPAVRGVSLSVDAGESVGIAGESGCGKSTLASTVLRLQPNYGRGRRTGARRRPGRQTIPWGQLRAVRWAEAAMVFQGALHSLNPVQRIGDQIAEPIRLHDETVGKNDAAKRVGELLEHVGLPASAWSGAYPHQLSGGQKQRVMIAIALACRPQLIIADEPTTALDVMVQAQVLSVLTELVSELGLGLMLISHDLSVLGTTCDRVMVMYAGRVVEVGPAASSSTIPAPVRRSSRRRVPTDRRPGGALRAVGLPGDPPDPSALPDGCAFHPRCALATDMCRTTDPPLETSGIAPSPVTTRTRAAT